MFSTIVVFVAHPDPEEPVLQEYTDSSSQFREADFSSKERRTIPKTLILLHQPSCTFCN